MLGCILDGRVGPRTVGLQDTEDLVTGDETDLWDAVRVTEGNTDLGRCEALARQLADVVDDVLGRGLEPRRRRAAVREGRGRYPGEFILSACERLHATATQHTNALSGSVHTTHDGSKSADSVCVDAKRHRFTNRFYGRGTSFEVLSSCVPLGSVRSANIGRATW